MGSVRRGTSPRIGFPYDPMAQCLAPNIWVQADCLHDVPSRSGLAEWSRLLPRGELAHGPTASVVAVFRPLRTLD